MNSHEVQIPGYCVHQQLGLGGMAVVYLATQESLKRKVAIKVLLDSNGDNAAERFVNEAHFIASLNHPRVITIHDISTLENGDYYIAMEYLDGGDLSEHYEQYRSPTKALNIIRQIAEGLALVHQKGIVHRDIKPANILFRSEGEAVLTDFGIAKDVEYDGDLTQVGFSLGSPSYSSPEQAQNHTIDGRSDIYSLGVIFLEMLLGYNVFKGQSHTETALKHIQMPLPELRDGLENFSHVFNGMLAKNPDDRYASCEALIEDLDILLAGDPDAKVKAPVQVQFDESNAGAEDRTILSSTASTSNKSAVSKPLVAAVSVLAFVLFFYFAFIYESEADKQMKSLLAEADLRMEEHKFVSPEKDNARYYYRQVLLLDAENTKAKRGLERVKEKQIESFIDQGMQSLEAGRIDSPKKNNAIHYFQQVLALDSDNDAANAGLQQVVNEYIRLANEAFVKKQYRHGHRYLARGLKVSPEDADLIALKEKYRDKKNSFRKFIDSVFK